MIEKYIQALKELALSDELNLGGADTVLGMLYECYNENHPYDNEETLCCLPSRKEYSLCTWKI